MLRFLLSIIPVILFTACSTQQLPHKSSSNVLRSNTDTYIINNIPLHYNVTITGYNARFTNDLLEVQINLKNNKQRPYKLEYRLRWFDETDFEVDKTPWLPLTVNAMEYRTVKQIAHSPDIKSFKFYIRAKQ